MRRGRFRHVRIRPPAPAALPEWEHTPMKREGRWPHAELVTLWGGPLDGEQLAYDPGDLEADPAEWGGYYPVPPEREAIAPDLPEGVTLRAVYETRPGEPPTTWFFEGWVPW